MRLRGPWASLGCTWSPDRRRLGGFQNTWTLTFAPFTLRQRRATLLYVLAQDSRLPECSESHSGFLRNPCLVSCGVCVCGQVRLFSR